MKDMERVRARGLTCLVTGATGGIGEAVATQLAARGATVLGVARTPGRADVALARIGRRVPAGRIEMLVADLSVLGQVTELAEQVTTRVGRLDVLILNAAVARPRLELTRDGLEVDFATNHLSPFLLIQRLRDLLCASAPARVITVSSSAHRRATDVDFDDLATGRNFHQMRTYAATKLLTVLFTTELGRQLAGSAVTVNAADPGFVRSGLGRDAAGAFGVFLRIVRPFQHSPDRGAATPLYLAAAAEVATTSGGYFANCRPAKPSALAQDQPTAQRLWAWSRDLLTRKVHP